MTFWCGAPLFDLDELEEEGRRAFEERFKLAAVFCHSFKEYAISCICGALYFVPENREEDMLFFLDINANLVRHLLGEGGAWRRKAWYVPDEREWVQLLPHKGGCIVSKQIEEGRPIGYMYRDKDASETALGNGLRAIIKNKNQPIAQLAFL